jgi:hypothetical protein
MWVCIWYHVQKGYASSRLSLGRPHQASDQFIYFFSMHVPKASERQGAGPARVKRIVGFQTGRTQAWMEPKNKMLGTNRYE